MGTRLEMLVDAVDTLNDDLLSLRESAQDFSTNAFVITCDDLYDVILPDSHGRPTSNRVSPRLGGYPEVARFVIGRMAATLRLNRASRSTFKPRQTYF